VNGEKEGKSWKCHATRHGNIIESDWESFGAAVIGDGGDSAAAAPANSTMAAASAEHLALLAIGNNHGRSGK